MTGDVGVALYVTEIVHRETVLIVDCQTGQQMVLTHRCGDCDAGLLMPHRGDNEYEVRCQKDPAHVSFVPKDWNSRYLYNLKLKRTVGYNIMGQ